MRNRILVLVLFTIASVASSGHVMANNNLFLPGDAFFPTVLTKAEVESLQTTKTGERTFAYSSFGGYEGAFCGYAGYANATIPAVDDALAKTWQPFTPVSASPMLVNSWKARKMARRS